MSVLWTQLYFEGDNFNHSQVPLPHCQTHCWRARSVVPWAPVQPHNCVSCRPDCCGSRCNQQSWTRDNINTVSLECVMCIEKLKIDSRPKNTLLSANQQLQNLYLWEIQQVEATTRTLVAKYLQEITDILSFPQLPFTTWQQFIALPYGIIWICIYLKCFMSWLMVHMFTVHHQIKYIFLWQCF